MMKKFSKYIMILAGCAAASLATVSCDEFPPVNYDNPDPYRVYTDADFNTAHFKSIKDVKAMYESKPVTIEGNCIIKAQVVSSDQSGNLYRTMYIQDATGGMEFKIGSRNLYNDYKLGQWVYIDCNGLTLGKYAGMVGLGYKSNDPEYESSYIDTQYIIDTHVFRGEFDEPVAPKVIEKDDIKNPDNFGTYVTIKNLKYKGQIFVMLYYDPDGDRKDYANNCVFLDENSKYGNYGFDTWAVSEKAFQAKLDDPGFNFNGFPDVDKSKFVSPSAYTISHYFDKDGLDLQIRTSGFARFADTKIDKEILSGKAIDVTGILTYYNKKGTEADANYQFTLLDLNGIKLSENQ